jgi:hypothetical protein
MKNRNSKDLSFLLAQVIKAVILSKLKVMSEESVLMYAMDLLSHSETLLPDERLSLFMAMPIVIKKIEASMSDESMEALSEAINESDMEIKEFIEGMLMEELDGQEFIATALMQNKSLTSMAELKADLTDLEKKKVGDRVTICHELLTNMLVTSEGVQMPSKSRTVPAVPELMGLIATVIAINADSCSYLCGGCKNNHIADTKIAYDDYNMEFYIDNDFIKIVSDDNE